MPVTLVDVEREHIVEALIATGWVVGGARGAAAVGEGAAVVAQIHDALAARRART